MKKIPYRVWLLVIFSGLLLFSNTDATTDVDRLLHHVPTLALMVVLIWAGVLRPLSNFTYSLIFVFLLLHVLGARYLYSYVPYDEWSEAVFGVRLNDVFGWERNHYDRLVHTSFGLLMYHPARVMCRWVLRVNGWRASVCGIGVIICGSTAYELIEWGVALVMSPDTAERYNGQQGDVWDAHKDTTLAIGGALVAWAIGTAAGMKPGQKKAPPSGGAV